MNDSPEPDSLDWQVGRPDSYTLKNIDTGSHSIHAWAIDLAGNISDPDT